MFKNIFKKGRNFLIGLIVGILLCGGVVTAGAAGNLTTLYNVLNNGIHIVIDGQELYPTDVNGNKVEPMIYNGTTYLPVRAVAGAFGKAVYWDGPNYTVYLGNMNGRLSTPTVLLKDMESINELVCTTNDLTDNYGKRYGSAVCNASGCCDLEVLLGMKYSRFKGTLYIPKDETSKESVHFTVTGDGNLLYTSPDMTKTSRPVSFDVNVTGYNDVKIEFSGNDYWGIAACLGDAGFYQ